MASGRQWWSEGKGQGYYAVQCLAVIHARGRELLDTGSIHGPLSVSQSQGVRVE